MTNATFEIKWWAFEEISNRSGKYNWAIDCKAGEETTYAYKTMFVNGSIVGETEKAYKVELDYIKLRDVKRTVYTGFTAWLPKKAVVNIDEYIDDITADDLRTYQSCGIE